MHGLIIRDAEPVDKLALLADLLQPCCDLLPAAVYDDRAESDQFQQGNILDHALFQFMVHHGAPAVFYDDRCTLESLYVGKRLDQHRCLVQIEFHLLL